MRKLAPWFFTAALLTPLLAFALQGPVQIDKTRVSESDITDGAVTTNKLGSASVTTPKLADGAVLSAKIGDGEVSTAKLRADSVTNTKLLSDAASLAKVTAGAMSISGNAISVLNTDTLALGTTFYVGNGRVGIGTTNPQRALDINPGSIAAGQPGNNGDHVRIGANGTNTNKYSGLRFGRYADGTSEFAGIFADSRVDRDDIYFGGGIGSLIAATTIHFYTTGYGGTVGSDRMTIVSNGSVGIGTTNPVTKLHIESGDTTTTKIQIGSATTPACEIKGVSGGGCAECVVTPGTFVYTCTTDADCVCDGS